MFSKFFQSYLVDVGSSYEDVLDLGDLNNPVGPVLLDIEVENQSGSSNALSGFKIQTAGHPQASYQDLLVSESGGDDHFADGNNLLILSGDDSLVTLAAGNKARVIVNVLMPSKCKIVAKSGGSANVKVHVSGYSMRGA